MRFDLPLPPSKNALHGTVAHERIRQEHEAMRTIWATACGQHLPSRDPPTRVRARAHFRTGDTWDEGNLSTALYSIVFDALQRPPGEPPGWRFGIHDRKGFIVDDSPRHLELAAVSQEVERNPKRRGLTLELEPVAQDGEGGAEGAEASTDTCSAPSHAPAGGRDRSNGNEGEGDRVCLHCGASLEGRNPRAEHCSDACRAAAWRADKVERLKGAEGQVLAAVREGFKSARKIIGETDA